MLKEYRDAWRQRVLWLQKPQMGGLSVEEAVEKLNGEIKGDGTEAWAVGTYKELLYRNSERIGWHSLGELHRQAPELAEDIWLRMKQEAREEYESGHFLARIFAKNPSMNTPANRAEFLAVRESMYEQWKPQGGIEVGMLDTMVMCYFMMRMWMNKLTKMMQTEPRMESCDYLNWKESHRYQYEHRHYNVSEAEAVEQASHEADRWRRAFSGATRQLRDWRRYSTAVIIQNAEQVNVASDGGQQMNVQKKKPSKKRTKESGSSKSKQDKRATKSEPKQLASKSSGDSIRMEPASESIQVE